MVTDAVAAEGASGATATRGDVFRSSWLDAVISWIDRLPFPTWVTFLGLLLAYEAWLTVEATLSSRGLFGQDPAYFAYGLFQLSPLLAYYLLSRGALGAWEAFRPATDVTDAQAARWRLEISSTPARPAAAIWVVGAAMYIVLLAFLPAGFDLVGHQLLFVFMRVISEAFWFAPISLMTLYLVFRQLRIASQLHREVVRVDLLQQGPLHALSRLTARSAILIILLQLVAFVPLPNMSDSARLALQLAIAPFLLVPVAAFFLPLRGLHALLQEVKQRRLGEVSRRIDSTTATLHSVIDGETGVTRDPESSRLAQVRIDGLTKALASLLQERDFLGKLSTWPWDTGTLRAVLSAVAVPILLFVVTALIDRFLL